MAREKYRLDAVYHLYHANKKKEPEGQVLQRYFRLAGCL